MGSVSSALSGGMGRNDGRVVENVKFGFILINHMRISVHMLGVCCSSGT